jgi:hypothetical protein
MITPNLQSSLFLTSKEEALSMANTTESLAGLWYNQNYLSFDIATVNELQQSQVMELCFIAQLFKSALNIDTINQLLISLPKPYAYDHNLVYFDVFANTWKMLPQEVEMEENDDHESMAPIEIFQSHWNKIKNTNKTKYTIVSKYNLQNGEVADVAILKDENCIAIGKYFENLEIPKQDSNREYFHAKPGFMGCGTISDFWFYFDNHQIIINDHKNAYPFDEPMTDFNMFFERINK